MLVYRGEKRFLAIDYAAVLAEGDALTGTPSVEIAEKRGLAPTTLAVDDPVAPAISGTEVRFWVDIPLDQPVGAYIITAECATQNGEVVIEKVILVVS